MLHLPKPLLSANVYCDRHLDEVVHRVLAPFWSEVREEVPGSAGYLWFIRYARCGEHVKLRLHAPEERRAFLVRRLEERTAELFAALPVDPEPQERLVNLALPPIDREDAAEAAYPDRTILWTDYQPSPITLGSEVLVPDQQLLALFTRALAAGTEVVLAGLHPDESGEFSARLRQNLVIKLALSVLAGLPFPADKAHEYLAYHRDWLVRYMLFKGRSEATAEELVARYDQRVRETPRAVATLRGVLESQLGMDGELDGDDEFGRLSQRVAGLFRYIVRFRDQPGELDPYAPDQVYLPIFKCLHGLSNQVGLGMAKEAQVYHLLATAAAELAGLAGAPLAAGPVAAETAGVAR
jgi:hypothetical protein